MREIKFRVCSEEDGVLTDVITMSWFSMWVCFEVNGEKVYRDMSKVVLMQYTGLKDMNGKEIYEGDIVKFADVVGYVEYYLGSYIIKVRDGYGSFYDFFDFYNEKGDLVEELEVIGNIYENPELLEKVE